MGTIDIFFGVVHRMKKAEIEEQFNKEAKKCWRFAADAARVTKENAGTEDRKHTSGGVFVAVDSNLGAVIGKEEAAVESIPGNKGRIAQAWVNVRGRYACLLSILVALGRLDSEEGSVA